MIMFGVFHQTRFCLILEQNAGNVLYNSRNFHLILKQNAGEIILKIQSSSRWKKNQMISVKDEDKISASVDQ